MKAIHTKPSDMVEIFGEMYYMPETKREVEIIQFINSPLWGYKAVCKIGKTIEFLSPDELEILDEN